MTSQAAPIESGQAVIYQGSRHVVSWLNYNVTRCPCGDYCSKADLDSGVQGVRVCQLTPAPAGMVEGQRIVAALPAVEVVLTCVRPGHAYRVSTCNGGFEIPELSRSYPTEVEARQVARSTVKLFNRGASVQLVLDSIAYAQHILNTTPTSDRIAA